MGVIKEDSRNLDYSSFQQRHVRLGPQSNATVGPYVLTSLGGFLGLCWRSFLPCATPKPTKHVTGFVLIFQEP